MEITWEALRFQMTTSQLVLYAKKLGISLSTIDGKYKKKIAKEIWDELKRRTIR